MLKILTFFRTQISKPTAEGTVPSMKRTSSTKMLVLAGTTSLLFLLPSDARRSPNGMG